MFTLSILVIEDFVVFMSMWNDNRVTEPDSKLIEKRTGKKGVGFQLLSG